MKRILERKSKVPEIAKREAHGTSDGALMFKVSENEPVLMSGTCQHHFELTEKGCRKVG